MSRGRTSPPLAGAAERDGTCFDPFGTVHLSEEAMSDREKNPEKGATDDVARPRGDDRTAPPKPDLGERADPDSQQSTTARPRGHTEDPDRTL
jgi:hypothetical protein